jgi:hypothetical protein
MKKRFKLLWPIFTMQVVALFIGSLFLAAAFWSNPNVSRSDAKADLMIPLANVYFIIALMGTMVGLVFLKQNEKLEALTKEMEVGNKANFTVFS